jgi:DNA-binding NtrC family response regulator
MEVQRNLDRIASGAVLPAAGTNGSGVVREPQCEIGVEPGDIERLIHSVVTGKHGERPVPKTLAARVDLLEQKIIESTLSRNRHHRKDTAAELGISRVTLYNKMKKFGMLN